MPSFQEQWRNPKLTAPRTIGSVFELSKMRMTRSSSTMSGFHEHLILHWLLFQGLQQFCPSSSDQWLCIKTKPCEDQSGAGSEAGTVPWTPPSYMAGQAQGRLLPGKAMWPWWPARMFLKIRRREKNKRGKGNAEEKTGKKKETWNASK